MLTKLMKYEFLASARTFIPIYILLLVTSFISGAIGFDLNGFELSFGGLFNMSTILLLIFSCTIVALVVSTGVMVIQRFKKNLLGDEGYLMFTLPVSSRLLIISKLVISILFIATSFIVGHISSFLLARNHVDVYPLPYFFSDLFASANGVETTALAIKLFQLIVVNGALSLAVSILVIYISITMGHIQPNKKLSEPISYVTLILLTTGMVRIVAFIFFESGILPTDINTLTDAYNWLFTLVNMSTLLGFIGTVVGIEIIHLLLTKKLELS
ncbi:MAG: hypothetical protein ATN35_09625 [Epulopiscium sp. Nele67-Bin004]|nr:MAG: hypothetical protein ATN35_09625 [Epulopiscium sp. Nele67-Bin004]